MQTKTNTEKLIHFPAGTQYSCGASLGQPKSADADKVTCPVCLTEAHCAAYAAEQIR